VCDECNQYFGSKIEKWVLANPPFVFERLAFTVRSKKGKAPKLELGPGIALVPGDEADKAKLSIHPTYANRYQIRRPFAGLRIPQPDRSAWYISRFILKIGLESLVGTHLDPYVTTFDAARRHARQASADAKWHLGYTMLPDRGRLLISTVETELGPMMKRDLYKYAAGTLPSGDIVFSLQYGQHVFAVNLSNADVSEHVQLYNSGNDHRMYYMFDERRSNVTRFSPYPDI
jgi:hypothetical protein